MANSADPDQLASKKPTDLDLHCLQRQGISGLSRTRVNTGWHHYILINIQLSRSVFHVTPVIVQQTDEISALRFYDSRSKILLLMLLFSNSNISIRVREDP